MSPSVCRTILFAVGILGAPSVNRAWAQDGALPKDLAAVARAVECSDVRDFYSRPGMVEPPYVYGITGGEREASFAFWCQRSTGRGFQLVVRAPNGIQDVLPWSDYPGGLSITEFSEWRLVQFRRVAQSETKGPTIVLTARRALQSSYDGVTVTLLKHEGVCYFRIVD